MGLVDKIEGKLGGNSKSKAGTETSSHSAAGSEPTSSEDSGQTGSKLDSASHRSSDQPGSGQYASGGLTGQENHNTREAGEAGIAGGMAQHELKKHDGAGQSQGSTGDAGYNATQASTSDPTAPFEVGKHQHSGQAGIAGPTAPFEVGKHQHSGQAGIADPTTSFEIGKHQHTGHSSLAKQPAQQDLGAPQSAIGHHDQAPRGDIGSTSGQDSQAREASAVGVDNAASSGQHSHEEHHDHHNQQEGATDFKPNAENPSAIPTAGGQKIGSGEPLEAAEKS